MCQFKSAIVLKEPRNKNGFSLIMSPWTEHHSDLIAAHNLRDDGKVRFARVEFSPPDLSTADKVETYKLRLDEERTPNWWTKEIAAAVTAKMTAYIKSIIISGDVALLMGGQFILAPGANVQSAKACVINAMLGTSKVGTMWDTSQVGEMWGTSQVGTMWDTSKVGTMRGTSQVGTMRDTSQVGTMLGTSKVGTMWDTSQVGTMLGTSQVGEMWDTSQVGTMLGTSQVGEMLGTSQVGTMKDKASANPPKTKA